MHEPENEYQWELLAKYLNREITEEEKNELFAWVNESPANRETFYRSTHLWHLTGSVKTDFQPNVEGAWQKFRTKMPESPATVAPPTQSSGRVLPLYFWRVAAAVLVLIGAVWLIKSYVGREEMPITLSAQRTKQLFLLPDSSRVYLNQNSSLTYLPQFAGQERVVTLRGEAFFEVKRNARKPFVVLTNNARTEVLGTSFTVRADTLKDLTEVQVVTGKVAFSGRRSADSTRRIILTPGFKAIVGPQGSLVKSKMDDPNFRAWQTEQLAFNNMPLDQVIASLQQYFGVTIEVKNDRLLNCRFTGTFEQPQLEDVLQVLAVSMQIEYNYEEKHYTLSGAGCQ